MADSFYGQIMTDIESVLSRCDEDKTPWRADWIAHQLMLSRADGFADGTNGEQCRWLAYQHARELVRRRIGKRIDEQEAAVTQRQIVLPGFGSAHLQERYLVDREGERIGIIVTDLSDEEIDVLADMHRKAGRAHLAHATELARFKAWRVAQRAA